MLQLRGSMALVGRNFHANFLGALSIDFHALVRQHSGPVELHLSPSHGPVKIGFGLLLVLLHPEKQSFLQCSTCFLVESHVAIHLSADSRNIALTSSTLSSNFPLHVAKVICQTHATVGGIRENLSGLLDISGFNRARSANGMNGRSIAAALFCE